MALMLGRLCRRNYSTVASVSSVKVPSGVRESIEKVLFINTPQDWYNVPLSYLKLVKGKEVADFAKKYTSIQSLVTDFYPDHQWDFSKFTQTKGKYGPQTFLERIVRSFFPNEEMIRNSRDASGLLGSKGSFLEVDIYFPKLKLGLEYQDPHHYFHSVYGAHTLLEYQNRDREKHKQAKEKGLTIINIPFWWDWNPESLIATIKKRRPDLLQHLSPSIEPINEEMPKKILERYTFDIPDLGSPMLALYMPQVRSFDPENWWVFEKYDGMRAVWNSKRRTMYSRWGTPLNIPQYICDYLPSFWLDGEIWFGREKNTRYQAVKINERTSITRINWNKFLLMAFDAPQPNLLTSPYSERYKYLDEHVPKDTLYVKVAPYTICIGRDHLETIYFHFRAQEGEGVIVRHPEAIYINGYSRYIFKHRGYNDAEALVLEKRPYGNVYLCRINKAQLAHNTRADTDPKEGEGLAEEENTREQESKEVEAGEENNDDDRAMEKTEISEISESAKKESEFYEIEIPVDEGKFDANSGDIEIGKFVSFYYTGELSGKGPPLNPKIYSARKDVTSWGQLLHNKKPKLHQRIWKPIKPTHSWTMTNQRKFFDSFAKERGFDPLSPKHWYSISASDIEAKIGRGLLQKYDDSLIKALFAVYPEIGLEETKFATAPAGYWMKAENRKKFFVDFAKSRGFDPEVAENWYSIENSDVLKIKGGAAVVKRYKNSLAEALMALFPNIGIKRYKFTKTPASHWETPENRRAFFEDFAKSKKFDPLNPENWYAVKHTDLIQTRGFITIKQFHGGSYAKALTTTYPNIGLEESKLTRSLYSQQYDTPEKRRAYMDAFAARHKFNPTIPDNWYSVTRESVTNSKGGDGLLKRYNRNLINALMDIYPDIGLKREKFKFATKNFKNLFVGLAKMKGFDSRDHRKWYSITAKDILEMPGSHIIKTVFPNLESALLHNFPNIGIDITRLDPSLRKELH